jgi:hypothetical protein
MGKDKSDEEQVDISQDMKSKVQPSQDNRDLMVKKLDKGATVTFYKCMEKGTSSTNALNLSRRWTRAQRIS